MCVPSLRHWHGEIVLVKAGSTTSLQERPLRNSTFVRTPQNHDETGQIKERENPRSHRSRVCSDTRMRAHEHRAEKHCREAEDREYHAFVSSLRDQPEHQLISEEKTLRNYRHHSEQSCLGSLPSNERQQQQKSTRNHDRRSVITRRAMTNHVEPFCGPVRIHRHA